MRLTTAAQCFIAAFRRMYSEQALRPVVVRAEEIARAKGALVLGRDHLREALEEIAREVEDEFEEDGDGGM